MMALKVMSLISMMVLMSVLSWQQMCARGDSRFQRADNLGRAASNLRYAFVMFRHGIRTSYWDPLGLNADGSRFPGVSPGGLTEPGQRLMENVGRSLATRYGNHAPSIHYTLVSSTHSSRTKMSAQYVVKGMFPGSFRSASTVLINQDTVYDKHHLFDYNPQCQAYANLKNIITSEETTPPARQRYYQQVTTELQRHNINYEVNSLLSASMLSDSLLANQLCLYGTPSWLNNFISDMENIAKLYMWRYIHSKQGMVSFFSGTMLTQVLRELQNNGGYKLHLHGSHDATLNAVFWSLGGPETYSVRQGDCIILEQYTDDTVQMYLYSPLEPDQSKRFQAVNIFNTNLRYGIQQLRRVLGDSALTEDQWNHICSSRNTNYPTGRMEPRY